MTNRDLLEDLFRAGQMNVRRAPLFDAPPPPLPPDLSFDRVEGMLLGLAVGDALGRPTEGPSWTPELRGQRHGVIRDYLHGRGSGSDDTQMAFWTLELLNRDRALVPQHLAELFVERGPEIIGIGHAVKEFIQRGRQRDTPWHTWAANQAGNGALMRIAPLILPHLRAPTADLWVDTALAARVTHNDSASLGACLAVVNLIWRVLAMSKSPEPAWWLEEYVRVARTLECQDYTPRAGRWVGFFSGPVWQFVDSHVRDVHGRGLSVASACGIRAGWGSGAYLLETVPSLLYVLMRHGHNFEEAVLAAVNDTKDNDTIAAVVGALLGALHGKQAIPQRWLDNLSGRTRSADDGQVFRLVHEARSVWWKMGNSGRHTVLVKVTTTHLEMTAPGDLRPACPARVALEVTQAKLPCPELNRFLYTAAGGDWYWIDRLEWTFERWLQYVARPELETWVGYVSGTPAAYFELEMQPEANVEIVYFGVLPQFIGQGIGGALLTAAVERAWQMGARRVWLHTCTLDHSAAVSNYLARGFRVFKVVTAEEVLPEQSPGPWPGAGPRTRPHAQP